MTSTTQQTPSPEGLFGFTTFVSSSSEAITEREKKTSILIKDNTRFRATLKNHIYEKFASGNIYLSLDDIINQAVDSLRKDYIIIRKDNINIIDDVFLSESVVAREEDIYDPEDQPTLIISDTVKYAEEIGFPIDYTL